jgi:uncharacterized membrane protein YdjX (TVP38/TMEM64 family)
MRRMANRVRALLVRNGRLFAVLVFVAVLLVAVEAMGLRQDFSLAFLRETLSERKWEGLFLFVLLFALGNLVHIPGLVFLAASVLVLGKWAGGLATYLAASVSCAVTFLSVRWVGGDAVLQMHGKLARRLVDHLHAHPIRNVIVLRTLFQTLAALNYTLALSGIGFRKYMLGTLLGLPLPIAFYCVFFDTMAKLVKLG